MLNRIIFSGSSEDRFEKLMMERLKPGADKKKIDQRIWDIFGERWCIMFTDLSGFSRGVAEFGIIHFLQTIHESQRLLLPVIDDFDGILLKIEGDSFLIIFKRVHKALKAAIKMQRILLQYNKDKKEEEKVLLCLGLGYGDVLKIGETEVFGNEVNAASKLGEDIARPWEILVTEAIKDKAAGAKGISFEKIDAIPPGAKEAFKVIYPLGE